jgi:hypothetical protein
LVDTVLSRINVSLCCTRGWLTTWTFDMEKLLTFEARQF